MSALLFELLNQFMAKREEEEYPSEAMSLISFLKLGLLV